MDSPGRKSWAWQFCFLDDRTTGVWAAFTSAVPRGVNISLCVCDVIKHLQARCCGRGGPSRASSGAKSPCANSACKAPRSPAHGRAGKGTGIGTGTSLLCVLGAGSAVAAPLCMFGMGAQQRGVVFLACFFLNPGVSPVISEILFSAGC